MQTSTTSDIERRIAIANIDSTFVRLNWLVAAARFELALSRHYRALKFGFNPDQPRIPRGNPTGGQWTKVAGGSPSGNRGRYGANFPGSTYGQQVRLDLNIARTQNALRQIRQLDQNWKPKTQSVTATDSIEGAIRDSEARAEEAEAHLQQLRSGIGGNFGPPLEPIPSSNTRISGRPFDGEAWINAFRATNNMPDLFGRPTWPNDKGTVAVAEIDGKILFGVNSHAPGYDDVDFSAARQMRDHLIEKYPEVMNSFNVGRAPNDSLFHAESTILMRAARENGGGLEGRNIEVHTDREMCTTSCEFVLPVHEGETRRPRLQPRRKFWHRCHPVMSKSRHIVG